MHSHFWCTKTFFTSFYRTDDMDRINNAIKQEKTMGNTAAHGFIAGLYSAAVATDAFMGKYVNCAFTHFIINLIH